MSGRDTLPGTSATYENDNGTTVRTSNSGSPRSLGWSRFIDIDDGVRSLTHSDYGGHERLENVLHSTSSNRMKDETHTPLKPDSQHSEAGHVSAERAEEILSSSLRSEAKTVQYAELPDLTQIRRLKHIPFGGIGGTGSYTTEPVWEKNASGHHSIDAARHRINVLSQYNPNTQVMDNPPKWIEGEHSHHPDDLGGHEVVQEHQEAVKAIIKDHGGEYGHRPHVDPHRSWFRVPHGSSLGEMHNQLHEEHAKHLMDYDATTHDVLRQHGYTTKDTHKIERGSEDTTYQHPESSTAIRVDDIGRWSASTGRWSSGERNGGVDELRAHLAGTHRDEPRQYSEHLTPEQAEHFIATRPFSV